MPQFNMPSLSYVSSRSFRSGAQNHSPENEHFDFCVACFKRIVGDVNSPNFARIREEISMPSDVEDKWVDVLVERPSFDLEDYRCHHCDRLLTRKDD